MQILILNLRLNNCLVMCSDVDLITSSIASICHRLKGLIISESHMHNDTRFTPQILSMFGQKQQLMSLHLDLESDQPSTSFAKSDKKFINLEEFCANKYVDINLLQCIINCAMKLRRFSWRILNGFHAE
eukprot:400793_1